MLFLLAFSSFGHLIFSVVIFRLQDRGRPTDVATASFEIPTWIIFISYEKKINKKKKKRKKYLMLKENDEKLQIKREELG